MGLIGTGDRQKAAAYLEASLFFGESANPATAGYGAVQKSEKDDLLKQYTLLDGSNYANQRRASRRS